MKMNIKALLCFSLFFFLTAYPQFSQEKNVKSDLMGAGAISVTIGGNFPINGTFPAFITERVDEYVSRMYAQAVDLTLKVISDPVIYRKLKEELSNYALRGIKLKRTSGEELILDLQKFRLHGDFTNNPYLKNDDVIIFPTNDISRNFFSVSGVVNKPGVFLYIEGDKLEDLLELVDGINPAYENVDSVEVSRLSYDGQTETVIKIKLDKNYPIQRGDRFRFIAPETQRRNFAVSVIGEVNIPGFVPITKNNTTLYDVIQSCGGFTPQASLKRARVFSENSLAILLEKQYNIKLEEQADLEDPRFRNTILNLELALMYRMSNVVIEDTNYFNLENQLRVLIEGSSLDFRKIEDPSSDIAKYIVQNGDIIVIPQIQNSVYVFGQVLRPGHVTFIEGKDYNYYVNVASGLGELAVEDDIMVIKGGSRAWISPLRENVEIEEGDYIYVPKENLRSFRSYVFEYSVYVSLLASIAAILLSLVTILNN
ncbi:MAG: SLBB domain-containing protein [Ignavibacteriaceae bacterium]|nr:SLBB domain-containing protein [Ignavibacteriaceae bacterium]